uniref:Uncharacterized protein n=1 Tax=Anguilla anguilla TaxID=7936 RepID=A0A0E9WRK2_ANGAN
MAYSETLKTMTTPQCCTSFSLYSPSYHFNHSKLFYFFYKYINNV